MSQQTDGGQGNGGLLGTYLTSLRSKIAGVLGVAGVVVILSSASPANTELVLGFGITV